MNGRARFNKKCHLVWHFLLNIVVCLAQKDAPERSAWRIREYTIRKIIKTELVTTSFYRFLLLRIEESPAHPPKWKTTPTGHFFVFGDDLDNLKDQIKDINIKSTIRYFKLDPCSYDAQCPRGSPRAARRRSPRWS